MTNVNFNEIAEFLEREIVPRYDNFDPAHSRSHAHYVMEESQRLAVHYPEVDPVMLLVAAAYHDLGLEVGRDVHHSESARIVRHDSRLLRWFTPEQVEIIAQAAEDPRASSDHEPRSIYGRLVAEADRQIDAATIVRRTLQYSFKHYPHLDRAGHIERTMEHLDEKYSGRGYLKLWIPESANAARLEEFRRLLEDPESIRELVEKTYNSLTQ